MLHRGDEVLLEQVVLWHIHFSPAQRNFPLFFLSHVSPTPPHGGRILPLFSLHHTSSTGRFKMNFEDHTTTRISTPEGKSSLGSDRMGLREKERGAGKYIYQASRATQGVDCPTRD